MKTDKVIVTFCGSCEGDKNHKKLFSKNVLNKDDDTENHYHVVQCMGCDTISFLRVIKYSVEPEDIIHFNYPDTFDFTTINTELLDEYGKVIPKVIYKLYDEVINSFESESVILTGIGLRTLVEAICIDQKIAGRNLKSKIENLHAKGLISASELPILDKLRQIGNVSAHEIKSLSLTKLEYALGIIDHVLKAIYVLPKLNRRLKM